MISNPDLSVLDFINYLSEELEMGKCFEIPSEFFIELTRFLPEGQSENSRIFIAIDEGHHISPGLLQIIQDILKIGVDNGNLAGILLVGYLSMNERLRSFKYENSGLPTYIQYQLDPLTEAETRQYIQHRLLIAGSEKEIFTADAAREIYLFSLGYPIMINIICDRALLTGYADSRTTLDSNVIRECAQELSIHSLEKI
jgi:general secretion pathway protein A